MKPVSGKIDRKCLPDLSLLLRNDDLETPPRAQDAKRGEATRTDADAGLEQDAEEVLTICRSVFETPIGWDDGFAEAGGHSIVIARLARRLQAAGWAVPVRAPLTPPSSRSTWARCWLEPATAATSRKRLKNVISELEAAPGAILFIDEIHTVVGAGATSGGSMDASNILKPSLASGTLRCMGSTTYKEYRNHFEKDRALVRRFQKIDIYEPSIEDTIKILHGLKGCFEAHHNVKYSSEALKSAVELSAKYINDRKLPDKAIDVIDEVGAARMPAPAAPAADQRHRARRRGGGGEDRPHPSEERVERRYEGARHLGRDWSIRGVRQDRAIEALASAIKLARAGPARTGKADRLLPVSGPTGVGKTEVARQLALILGIELVRFDMSEYTERHSVSRLIGAPPGYVGFDQGGLLTDAIDKQPHAVLLLDEIEKAHPDLFSILLQVMDHGKLTDHNGKSVDFRNVILMMTTNAGAFGRWYHPPSRNNGRRSGSLTSRRGYKRSRRRGWQTARQ